MLLSLSAMIVSAAFLATPRQRAASPSTPTTITTTSGGNTGFNNAVLGDVNGDGYLDAVGIADATNQGGVFINQRNGAPGVPPTFVATGQSLPVDTTNLARVVGMLGDIDGDNDLDIFAVPLPYFNGGTGNFTASTQAPLSGSGGFRPTMKLADLDGDGDLDAVTIARSSGPYVYQNNGSGVFTLVQTLSVTFPAGSIPDGWTNVTAVDFDGDGDLDLLLDNSRAWAPIVMLNNGSNHFTQSFTGVVGSSFNRAADMDGDGDIDIATGGATYFNDGHAHFTRIVGGTASGTMNTSIIRLIDLDFNGFPDAVNSIWTDFGDGAGFLTSTGRVSYPTGTSAGWFDLGDIDNNGIPEIVRNAANGGNPLDVVWFSGITPPITNHAPNCSGATIANQTANANCQATISGANVSGVSDPDNDTLTITVSPTTLHLGANSVTVTADDGKGGTCSTTVTVNVTDSMPPQLTAVPPNASYQCLSQVPAGNPSSATATDNCSTPTITVADASNGGAGTPASPLIITRVFIAKDAANNTNSATQTITVIDNTPPSITAPPNIAVNTGAGATLCGAVVSEAALGAATASDNCGSATITRSGVPAGNFFPVGTTTITYTATDGKGNTQTATQTVSVADNTLPVISCPAGTTVSANASCQATVPNVLGSVTASDNCTPAGSLTKIQSPVAGTLAGLGTTMITVTVTDAAGNTSTCTTPFTVVDHTAPTITAPVAVNASTGPGATVCGVVLSDATLGNATAGDNCGSVTITRSGVPAGNFFPVGTTIVTYTATDAAGNTKSATQSVTVVSPDDYDGDGSADPCDPDDDNDGVPDASDAFPRGSLLSTVSIAGCNTSVPNHVFANGASFNDLIAQCAANAKNHGDFVSCVSALTNQWKSAGLITGAQKGTIMSCASAAAIP